MFSGDFAYRCLNSASIIDSTVKFSLYGRFEMFVLDFRFFGLGGCLVFLDAMYCSGDHLPNEDNFN